MNRSELFLSILTGVSLFCAAPPVLQAANFLVTNADNSGAGTLRQAIADANANAGADTIEFDTAGIFATPQIITLTSGELLMTDSVSITGPGADLLAINGNYPNTTNRVFHIGPGTTVTIAGLTITNGYLNQSIHASTKGGGILNDQATLTISNCILTGDFAGSGGAICNDGGPSGSTAVLQIINSTVRNNSGPWGAEAS